MSLEQRCSELKKDVVQFAEEVRRSGFVKPWHTKTVTDGGVLTKRFAKGTAANDPPNQWIDGVRELIDRLNAAAIIRANEDVRSALLRDAGFLALMRQMEKDPSLRDALVASIQRAERVAGGPEEPEAEEPVEPFDHQAFAEAKERGRRLHLGREAMKMPVVIKRFIENIQAIADDLAAGGKGVSASDVAKMTEGTRPDTPAEDWGLRKADGSNLDPKTVKLGRRMNQSEILR